METAWTSTPSYGFRQFVRNLLIKLDKICQATSLRHRAHSPPARRPQPATDRPHRPLEPPLDGGRHTLPAAEPIRLGGGVGVCHRPCRGYHLSVADAAV